MSNKQQNRVTKFTQDKIPTIQELLGTEYEYVYWDPYGNGYIYKIQRMPNNSIPGEIYEVAATKTSNTFTVTQDASLILRLLCRTDWVGVSSYSSTIVSVFSIKIWQTIAGETTLYKEYAETKLGAGFIPPFNFSTLI
jgi:hypothetical protein